MCKVPKFMPRVTTTAAVWLALLLPSGPAQTQEPPPTEPKTGLELARTGRNDSRHFERPDSLELLMRDLKTLPVSGIQKEAIEAAAHAYRVGKGGRERHDGAVHIANIFYELTGASEEPEIIDRSYAWSLYWLQVALEFRDRKAARQLFAEVEKEFEDWATSEALTSQGEAQPQCIDPPLRVGGSLVRPEKLYSPTPRYTAIAEKARIHGIVIIEGIVDLTGRFVPQQVVKGLPMGLDGTALEAAKMSRFTLATIEEQPVCVFLPYVVGFQIVEEREIPSPDWKF